MENEFELYRNSVRDQWDSREIEVKEDIPKIKEIAREDYFDGLGFDFLREGMAMFGAAETEVTEDLAPLAVVEDDIETQYFITSQLYDESRHSDFFKYYWNEVINTVEEERGMEISSPTDEKFFSDSYEPLFEANEEAMKHLLNDNSPEAKVNAYSHYHITLEGIVAQTGYWSFNQILQESNKETPTPSKLLKGINLIRQDEARHVGFGVTRIIKLLRENNLSINKVKKVPKELFPHMTQVFNYTYRNVQPHHPTPSKTDVIKRITNEQKSRIEYIEKNI